MIATQDDFWEVATYPPEMRSEHLRNLEITAKVKPEEHIPEHAEEES